MSVRTIYDPEERVCCFYDAVTGTAFGPIFRDGDGPDQTSVNLAEEFLGWLICDARLLTDTDLRAKHTEWLQARRQVPLFPPPAPPRGQVLDDDEEP